MPISNCTDDDVGYDVDSDPDLQALTNAVILTSVSLGAATSLLVTSVLAPQWMPAVAGGILGLAGITGLVRVRRILRFSDSPGFFSRSQGKRILRKDYCVRQPLNFHDQNVVTFCEKSGEPIATITIGDPTSVIEYEAAATEEREVPLPVGLVSLHGSKSDGYEVRLLREEA